MMVMTIAYKLEKWVEGTSTLIVAHSVPAAQTEKILPGNRINVLIWCPAFLSSSISASTPIIPLQLPPAAG